MTENKNINSSSWQEIKGIQHVLIRGDEILILGTPQQDDEKHNCDFAGCSSVMDVLFRGWLRGKEIHVSTVEYGKGLKND